MSSTNATEETKPKVDESEAFVPPHIAKLEDDAKKRERERDEEEDEPKETPEFDFLLEQVKQYKSPGMHVVAVGPTMLLSMYTTTRATEHAISKAAHSFVTNLASGHRGYGELKYIEEKHKWYDNMARGTDAYNRAIDSGYFMHGAVTVFNGLDGVLFSDQTKKQNANFECGSACGRRVQLHHVVSGFLSKATRFQSTRGAWPTTSSPSTTRPTRSSPRSTRGSASRLTRASRSSAAPRARRPRQRPPHPSPPTRCRPRLSPRPNATCTSSPRPSESVSASLEQISQI
jgi:hypothetical protein